MHFLMVFDFIQFWLDGRPSYEYFWIPHKISDLLTPLTPLGVRPQWFETDFSHSSYSAVVIRTYWEIMSRGPEARGTNYSPICPDHNRCTNIIHSPQNGYIGQYIRFIVQNGYIASGTLHCQCILSIFPASVHQFYSNLLVFVNINPFLYINDQFALSNISVLYYNISKYLDQRTLVFYFYPMYNAFLGNFCSSTYKKYCIVV
jgi:hypothetical protein